MLNNETRRKIDNARDILVGKLPDPKAQIEQITTALIYKFMHDMDNKSVAIGGKAAFFTDEYEKYAWDKLMSPKLGGNDRLNLYMEAITKLGENPHLPPLFRNIFKDAFLPYRDPETLNLFLKEISWFTYSHSEDLGDAKDETILDPACGTAGFLISAYKHILRQNMKENPGDRLTPDEKDNLVEQLTGYDISPDMVKLSLVNMYLHGFQNPNISEYDTLSYEDKWDEYYDVIMANPPFMTPKGGIRPHKRFAVQANRSEVLFVDYIAEHLTANGRAGVIVPEGIIFQSANAYKALRKMLVENYLFAVVSLPAGVFNPYSGVKTSILIMDKALAKKTDKILFTKIENDGLDLGAQRKPIEKNDLPKALEVIKNYINKLKLPSEAVSAALVLKSKIGENGDYNLSGERYKEGIASMTAFKLVPVGRFMKNGVKTVDPRLTPDEIFELWSIPAFDAGSPELIRGEAIGSSKKVVFPRDVLLSRIIPHVRRGWVVQDNEGRHRQVASTEWIVFSSNEIVPEYLRHILLSDFFHTSFMKTITGVGGSLSRANPEAVKEIQIPLPPLEIQQEIVAEIEGYQKIIDGASQVVENYKPRIEIDPKWETINLKDLVEIRTGKIDVNKAVPNGKYPFFTCSKELYYIDDYAFDCEALLLAGNNATGDFDVKHYRGKFNAYQRTYVITIAENKLDTVIYPFLKYIIDSNLGLLQRNSIGSQTKYLTLGMIQQLKIPMPSIEIQRQLAVHLEKERALVNSNKELITIFEQKIKDKIARIWGD
jgi:type I restriction enzyme M protein